MANDYDGTWQEDTSPDVRPYAPLKPGDPGYRQSPWAPSYDPGPNWNNGVAPPPPTGRYDYNNGSPVNSPDEPLKAGNSWEWQGPQTPFWDANVNQWQRGVWNQKPGSGSTGGPPPPGGSTGGAPTGGGGVSAIPGGGMTIPGSTLPGDIAGVFGTKPAQTPIQSAYQDALLKYMGRSQELPSLSDSTLAPQVEVYRAGAQRGQERNRLKAAERAAATGQSESGYLDNLINQGVQNQGMQTAGFNANLLGGEMNKRREELQAALQLASATGNQEAARELQNRLAQASAMMGQQSLNLQGQLGQGDLSLRLMQTLFGQDNFYDQLGVNTALGMEGLNQSALRQILGGS